MARNRFLVSYDVTDDKRRTRVHRALRDFGDWLQYSLFRCDLSPREITALRAAVQARLRPGQAVVISADKGVRYERVMQVMDALQSLGVAHVGLLVKPAQP